MLLLCMVFAFERRESVSGEEEARGAEEGEVRAHLRTSLLPLHPSPPQPNPPTMSAPPPPKKKRKSSKYSDNMIQVIDGDQQLGWMSLKNVELKTDDLIVAYRNRTHNPTGNVEYDDASVHTFIPVKGRKDGDWWLDATDLPEVKAKVSADRGRGKGAHLGARSFLTSCR